MSSMVALASRATDQRVTVRQLLRLAVKPGWAAAHIPHVRMCVFPLPDVSAPDSECHSILSAIHENVSHGYHDISRKSRRFLQPQSMELLIVVSVE